ncbi:protein kinase domain-containing protein [Nocardiopsis prasina]|uniref:protein kinase domain-containing protein n=1 Tax=Nocardiopsis prasina TaxID=2015 RepID=UPI0003498444|nr:protein kinase [Nocardiopsis prasina]
MRPVGPNDPRQIGPYRLTHLLGQGGMGQVFLGRTRGGWDVVVKIIRPDRLNGSDSRSPEYRARFAREAQAARSVGGFYTAHVLDADPHAEQPWIATAYIPGPTLSRAVRDQGPMSSPAARRLAARLAEGLLAIHAHGLIHRDLKPGNIILADDGPKIIDFGIARPLDNTAISSTGRVFGTLSFMSPEQARGLELTPASDVFSLGTVLAFASTGVNPFRTDSAPATLLRVVAAPPLHALEELSPDLRDAVTACWSHTPEERPAPDDIITLLYEEDAEAGDAEPQPTVPQSSPSPATLNTLERTTEPVPEAEPVPGAAPKLEAEAEPEVGPEPEAETESTAMRHSMVPQVSPPTETLERRSEPASEGGPRTPPEPTTESVPEPGPEVGAVSEVGPDSETAPEAEAESGPEPEAVAKPRPEVVFTSKVGFEFETELEPMPDADPEPGPEQGGEAEQTTEAVPRLEQSTVPEPAVDSVDEKGPGTETTSSPSLEPEMTVPNPNLVRGRPALRVLSASAAALLAITVAVLGPMAARRFESGPEPMTFDGHPGQVETAGFAPDAATLVTAGDDAITRVWDASNGEELHVLQGHRQAVTAVAYAPHGGILATASADHSVRIWDARSGQEIGLLEGHTRVVTAVAYAPNRGGLATGSADQTARIWSSPTDDEPHVLEAHSNVVTSVTYSPDSRTLATTSRDATTRLWNSVTGAERIVLEGHDAAVVSAVFSPDGTTLTTTSHDNTARVWDTQSGRELHVLQGHDHFVTSAVYAPDGSTVVTSSNDNTARVWDLESGEELRTLRGHSGPVTSVVYAPDGSTITTTSTDRTARVWDPEGGMQLHVLEGHRGHVLSAAHSPAGSTLTTVSRNGAILVWRLG